MFKVKSKFYKNLQYVMMLNIFNRVLSSINIFIISLFFPADHYGAFVWITTVVSYFAILCDLGIETYAQREVAEKSEIKASDIFFTRLFLSVLSLISCLGYLLIFNKVLLFSNLYFLIPFYLIFFSLQFSWVFSGKQQFKPALVGAIIQNTAALICIILGLLFNNISFVAISLVASYGFSGAYFCWRLRKEGLSISFRDMPPLSLMRKILAGSIALGLTRAFVSVAVSFDIYLIGLFLPYDQVGQYFIVFKIMSIAAIPALSIASVLQPALSNEQGESDYKRDTLRKTFLLTLVASSVICSGILLAGNNVFLMFYRGKYSSAPLLFCLLGFRLFFVYFSYYFSTVLVTKRKDQKILVITLVSSSVTVLLDLLFIPKLGINGAAAISLGVEALTCLGYLGLALPFLAKALFALPHIKVWWLMAFVLLLLQTIFTAAGMQVWSVVVVGSLVLSFTLMIKNRKYA